MNGRSALETVMGAVVLVVAGLFLFFSYSSAGVGEVDGYAVTAEFDNIGSLGVGADVRMSGIRIGSVAAQRLDPETYSAVVTLSIDPSVRLPEDTAAKISNESLLGGAFVALTPGGADGMIPDDGKGRIRFAQSAVGLEDLIGRFVFGGGNNQ